MHDAEPRRPELIFGLVGAMGTNLDLVTEVLVDALAEVRYEAETIHLIGLLKDLDGWGAEIKDHPVHEKYTSRIDAGNKFRRNTGRPDALALLGVRSICEERKRKTGNAKTPANSQAYVLRSLKHPAEVQTLRRIYGSGFFLIGANSPRSVRTENLAENIAASTYRMPTPDSRQRAEELIRRDEKEPDEFGQNVRDTFPLSDFFIDLSRPRDEVRSSIRRFVALIFNNQFLTPSQDEYAMFMAYGAALRSAELGRQVGAALTSDDGEIIALGTNEVPKPGGGLYWPDDEPDRRDFQLGLDTNDRVKFANVAEVVRLLKERGWFKENYENQDESSLVQAAIGVLRGTRMRAAIEYGRAVHAEMAAFIDAARRGVNVKGATLYTTTFPCHNCVRHIVASGVKRVVYVEPYAKSLGEVLHSEAVVTQGENGRDKVRFEAFVGVAPRQYIALFQMGRRKGDDGEIVKWVKERAYPRLEPPSTFYLDSEDLFSQQLLERLNADRG